MSFLDLFEAQPEGVKAFWGTQPQTVRVHPKRPPQTIS
jgi:hypothetical protein